ncbi:MAG TPA: hypothetical protein VLE91_01625, partial [Candidatus Saccharimonadales bacterium]|nr:hypothetical protein [Candidatus Saccharimonadales bacterium]
MTRINLVLFVLALDWKLVKGFNHGAMFSTAFIKKYFLIVATVVLVAVFYIRIAPPAVLDTYFHLAVGRQVWETKQIPTRDDFIYSDVDKNYTSNVWLSGLIFYGFVKTFGIGGMLVLKV